MNFNFVIGLIIFGAVTMIALIIGMIFLFRFLRKKATESGEALKFVCSKCNRSFEMPLVYFFQHPFTPRRSVTMKVAGTGGTVKMERRLTCPNCEKKTWCKQILKRKR